MDAKQISFGLALMLVPAVVTLVVIKFAAHHIIKFPRVIDQTKTVNIHSPDPGISYEDSLNQQTRYFNAKIDGIADELKRHNMGEASKLEASLGSRMQDLVGGAKVEIVDKVQDVGNRVAQSEGRMDALTLNQNFTKVFYPVGQQHLFFDHFPSDRYQARSRAVSKKGTVIGYEYSVKRRVDVKNYSDPYNKSYQDQQPKNHNPRAFKNAH
jgi:hypothetical protein